MPFRDFTAGAVLTANQIDEFLMRQAVMVFDDDTDRTSSLGTFVAEGMVTFLKDANSLEFYDGSVFRKVNEPAISPLLLLGV